MDLTWFLSILYTDFMDWHNWLWSQRRVGPAGLAGMGSDNCMANTTNASGSVVPYLWCKKSWGMGQLQGARFESLDNSPMYDNPGGAYQLWNSTTLRMQLYDIGQTAAIVAECESLAEIADILGYKQDAALLRQRQAFLGALMTSKMWNEAYKIYANVLFNDTSFPRISPTSFYPMLSGAATDIQAETMVRSWLTNATRFCVPADPSAWPPKKVTPTTSSSSSSSSSSKRGRNSSTAQDGERVAAPVVPATDCYWGIPSISADDAAFLVPGGTSGIYWRGETWAPQAYLVYMGLQRYDHLPAVRAARQGLAVQQADMLLNIWHPHHHVCENYASVKQNASSSSGPLVWTGPTCTGNDFYMWGGLPAFMALEEGGFYA